MSGYVMFAAALTYALHTVLAGRPFGALAGHPSPPPRLLLAGAAACVALLFVALLPALLAAGAVLGLGVAAYAVRDWWRDR